MDYTLFAVISDVSRITLHDTEIESEQLALIRIDAGASRLKIRDLSTSARYAYKYWDPGARCWIKVAAMPLDLASS